MNTVQFVSDDPKRSLSAGVYKPGASLFTEIALRGREKDEQMTRALFRVGSVLALMSSSAVAQSNAELDEQVRQREAAFAKTMGVRNHAGFVMFLASDAVLSFS